MTISISATWLIAFLLASVRAGAWLMVAPPFASAGTRVAPPTVMAGIAAGFGLLSAPLLQAQGVPTTTPALIGAVVVQVFTGAALGFIVSILVATVAAAGGFVDQFGGINPPPAVDPLSENQQPLFGQLWTQVAVLCLFVSNGELLLVRGFELSFATRGLTLASSGPLSSVLVGDLATFFTAALEIAAPIVVVLFAVQVSLALVAKAAPQLNAWWLGMPLQVAMSLVLSALAIRVVPGYLSDLVNRALQDTRGLLASG